MNRSMFCPAYSPAGVGGLKTLSSAQVLSQFLPHYVAQQDPSKPKRKSLDAPVDTGQFIKPLKQCFMTNPKLMPGTRIMLAMLSGWAGRVGAITTTTGALGKHLSRCRRQTFRYLKDAAEEGYLMWSRTKDRMGYYTGIKIYLNFGAIRHTYNPRPSGHVNRPKSICGRDVTQKSEINSNTYLNTYADEYLTGSLRSLAKTIGVKWPDNST